MFGNPVCSWPEKPPAPPICPLELLAAGYSVGALADDDDMRTAEDDACELSDGGFVCAEEFEPVMDVVVSTESTGVLLLDDPSSSVPSIFPLADWLGSSAVPATRSVQANAPNAARAVVAVVKNFAISLSIAVLLGVASKRE